MGRKVIHIQADKSWWTGRITALCGVSHGPGEYKKPLFYTMPVCPACKRIAREGRR